MGACLPFDKPAFSPDLMLKNQKRIIQFTHNKIRVSIFCRIPSTTFYYSATVRVEIEKNVPLSSIDIYIQKKAD